MQSQYLHDTHDTHEELYEQAHYAPSMDYPWLNLVIHHLHLYCTGRAVQADIELFSFALSHLFTSIETLYTVALPKLTTVDAVLPEEKMRYYNVWETLKYTLRILERVEILCHLLTNTTVNMLQSLDTTSSQHDMLLEQLTLPMQENLAQETIWADAFLALEEHLHLWQEGYTSLPSFTFALVESASPTLSVLDTSFHAFLKRTLALFGDILPDMRAMSVGDDEAITTCLLDILQQNDEMQVHIDLLVEPIAMLVSQYATALRLR